MLLAVLALTLRCFRLGEPSLWYDEGNSLRDAGELTAHAAYRPLYYLLLRVWAPLGSGEAWLRIPSAVASAGSVLLLYFLARRLAGTRAAVLAALLMTLSVQELDHAQEVRMYALGSLLSLGAVSLLWRWYEHRRLPALAGHGGVAALALATTPVTLLLIAPAVVYAVWRLRGERRDLARLAGVSLALLAALLSLAPAVAGTLARVGSSPRPPSWPPAVELLYLPAKVLIAPIGFLAREPAVTALFRVFGVCCLALLALAALARRRGPAPRLGAMLAMWFVLPSVAVFLVARTVLPFWTTRYFLALAPVLYLALALGVEHVLQRARGVGIALAAFVLGVLAVRTAYYYVEPQREDWRAAVAFVNAVAMPGDVVWLGGSGVAAIWAYYDRSGLPTRDAWTGDPAGTGGMPSTAAAGSAFARGGRILLVRRLATAISRDPAVAGLLPPGTRRLGSYRAGWATAQVLVPGPPPAPRP